MLLNTTKKIILATENSGRHYAVTIIHRFCNRNDFLENNYVLHLATEIATKFSSRKEIGGYFDR